MATRDGPPLDEASHPALAGALIAAAPEAATPEDLLRCERVRQRLVGGGTAAVKIGRFAVLDLVGSGAMSVVYAAYDEELDRKVAVKLLRAPLEPGDARLRREARALARLSHPNVVAVHEIGSWDGGLFIAMELVRGQTLEAWLGAHPRTWREIVEVFLQAGRGLEAAHDLGLIHRDFKPANVMIGEDGRARVLDFGLVLLDPREGGRALATTPPGSGSLTVTGACIGTPAYMAPELRARATASARSDQFSFAVSLHEALFGALPGGELAPPRDGVPARLCRILDRGLATDPRARWSSMGHLLGELTRLRWPARRWRAPALALGTAALIGIIAVAAQHEVRREQHARAALEDRARDARLLVAAQRLSGRDPTAAAAALREVRQPETTSGWRSAASSVLLEPLSTAIVRDIDMPCRGVASSRDGRLILVLLVGGDLLIARADGAGAPARLRASPYSDLTLSADHEWALTWGTSGKAHVSRIDGSMPRTLGAPGARVASAAFEGAGAEVVTVSTAGTVQRWRDGRPEELSTPPRELAIRDPSSWAFLLGPTGRHVMGFDPSGARWVWRARGPGPAVRVAAPDRPARRAWFSSDERWLVVAFEGGELALWNMESGSPPRALRGHEQNVIHYDFSRDGRWLATSSYDRTARVWATEVEREPHVLRGHTAPVDSVRFDPEARRVVTASYDRTVRVWSLDGSSDVAVLRGHPDQVGPAAFTPDGTKVVSCSSAPDVRVWDVSERPVRILGRHGAAIWSASLDPDRRRLVSAAHDGTATIWDLDGNHPPLTLRGHEGKEVYAAVFSPDGRWVATGADDGTARIWRADGSGTPKVLRDHFGWVYGLAFSPDSRWLATGSKDGEVRISPVEGPGNPFFVERGCGTGFGGRITSIVFHPRGDRIVANAFGCADGAALWWIGGARPRAALGGPQDARFLNAMSSDGRIATGGLDGAVHIWSDDGLTPLLTLHGHRRTVHSFAFSHDGRRLLSASFDDSARLWDLERPGEAVILRGHEDRVSVAAFDADERRVVTASHDRTARVWRLDDPDQPVVLRGHEDALSFAGFTADGRIVTTSHDGTVRLWSVDGVSAEVPALMERLRHATSVCLTVDQRMQYLDEPDAEATERFAACERAAGR